MYNYQQNKKHPATTQISTSAWLSARVEEPLRLPLTPGSCQYYRGEYSEQ